MSEQAVTENRGLRGVIIPPADVPSPEYTEAARAFNAVAAQLRVAAKDIKQLAEDLAKRPELIPLDAAWRKAQRLEHALAVDLPEHRRLLVELWGHSAQAKGGLDATGQSGEDQSAPYRELGADTADAILDLIDRRIDAALTEQRERLKAAG